MSKIIVLLVSTLLFILPITSQVIVWSEDFEDHGNTANGGAGRYTSDHDFHGGSNDYFGRVLGTTEDYYLTNTPSGEQINSETTYTNWSGDFYYAAEDLDDEDGTIGDPDGLDYKDLTISNIDISGAFGLRFKGLFAAGENGPCSDSSYDDADFVEVYYEVDGGGEQLGMCFNPDLECNIPADITNEQLYSDDFLSQGGACDGDGGGGTLITANFAEFSFLIPDGALLDLRIRVHMDSGSEEFAFDKFEVEAEFLGINKEQLAQSISVRPNPSLGVFVLSNAQNIELSKGIIFTILGEQLQHIDLSGMEESLEIDLSNYASGIYFLKVVSKKGNLISKKLILE